LDQLNQRWKKFNETLKDLLAIEDANTASKARAAYMAEYALLTAESLTVVVDGVNAFSTLPLPGLDSEAFKRVGAPLAVVSALGTASIHTGRGASPAEIFSSLYDIIRVLNQLPSKPAIEIPEGVEKFMLLLVELANARDSDQVARTLDAAAAPVGSWRVKHRRPSLTINAFLGVTSGGEFLLDSPGSTGGTFSGLSAPVGLHGTMPLGHDFAAGGLVTFLDLGALTALRMDAAKGVNYVPNVGFAQVFSPGGFVTLNWKMLTLGAGLSGAPLLRNVEVKEEGSTTPIFLEKSALRLHLFLGIDVTLFHLL
jgi:hypothetical protein